MKDLMNISKEQLMTIREIAEVLGSRPEDVLRSAKRLEVKGVINIIPHANGGKLVDQSLNKLDSITLVAQNKPEVTKAIVQRWDELESRVSSMNHYDLMRHNIDRLEAQEAEVKRLDLIKAEQVQVDLIEKTITNLQDTVRGSQCPYGTLPAYKMAQFFGVPLDSTFKELLSRVRSYEYYFASGANNSKRKAISYEIEDVRTLLENY
jgi:phage regulator Rha-like protein